VQGPRASWRAWLVAYELYRDALPGLPGPRTGNACPNCGAAALRLAFTGLAQERVGYAAFWCDRCLVGIHLSRCPLPEGVPVDSIHTPVEQRSVRIPNYTLLWPEEDGTD